MWLQALQQPARLKPETRLVVMCSRADSVEMACLPLVMAMAARGLGMGVELFFTLQGLGIIARRTAGRLEEPSAGGKNGLPAVKLMVARAKKAGVKLYACGPSMKAMGLADADLVPGVDAIIDSTAYLDLALLKPELYMICLADSNWKTAAKGSRPFPVRGEAAKSKKPDRSQGAGRV